MPNKKNPYANATGAYDKNAQQHTPNQREMEARVLLKAVKAFQDIQKRWDTITAEELDDALKFNRQIWMMFVDTAVEDDSIERPLALRNNIANLGVYIFNHTIEILGNPKPEKLNILIDINRDIAAGLMSNPDTPQKKEPAPDTRTTIST